MVSEEMVGRTVINADDFGLNHEVNKAVTKAYWHNNLYSVSMIVTTEGFKEAVSMAVFLKNLDVGLHLSLTTPWRNYRQFIWQYYTGQISEYTVYRVFKKQIEKFPFELQRIDSHHGVHFFPKVWKVLMRLMKEYNIKYVRNPPRRFCWFHYNPKLWLGKNKAWLFYKINKGGESLPYKEIICHPGK